MLFSMIEYMYALNKMTNFYEKQYSALDDVNEKFGIARMGLMSSFTWNTDPRRLLFVLARYKFVSKMFIGFDSVLEIGCGDGFGSRIVSQTVKKLSATDIDRRLLENAKEINARSPYPIKFFWHDFLEGPTESKYQGIYLLDVLEHIPSRNEVLFLEYIKNSMSQNGQLIIGIPSLESQAYASPASLAGHVNCKSKYDLKDFLQRFFTHVSMFSMNDEVLHTGFEKMSNYILAVCS